MAFPRSHSHLLMLYLSASLSSFLSSMVSNRENPTNQLQQQQWILKKKKQNLLATPDSNDIGKNDDDDDENDNKTANAQFISILTILPIDWIGLEGVFGNYLVGA